MCIRDRLRGEPAGKACGWTRGLLVSLRLTAIFSSRVIDPCDPEHIGCDPKNSGHTKRGHTGNNINGQWILWWDVRNQYPTHEEKKRNCEEKIEHNSRFGYKGLIIVIWHAQQYGYARDRVKPNLGFRWKLLWFFLWLPKCLVPWARRAWCGCMAKRVSDGWSRWEPSFGSQILRLLGLWAWSEVH